MPWEPDYVPVDGDDGLAAFVRVDEADPFLPAYGTAASRAVDRFCNRQFGQLAGAAVMYYPAHRAVQLRDGRWHLPIDDVQDVTAATVTVDGALVAAGTAGYRWEDRNDALKGRAYTGISLADRPTGDDVEVYARFGWSAVPAPVPAAVRLQVNRWHIRRESPYGTAGSPADGTEVRLTAVLDPDVRSILAAAGLVRKRMPL